jgi:uncharacterized protein (DUF927 family)
VAAGELATELGLTGWSKEEVSPQIRKCLRTWIETREPSEQQNGLRAVRQFLELHGASRFQDAEPVSKTDGSMPVEKVINRAGFRRMADDGETQEYLFLPEVFRSEVCRGFDRDMVIEALKEKNYLVSGKDKRNTQTLRIPGVGVQRVYVISNTIFNTS